MSGMEGMVAVITGAGSPMGQVTAKMLAERGVDVVLTDIALTPAVEDSAQAIRQLGRRALTLQFDYTQEPEVEQAVAQVVAEFGKINILINYAAGTSPKFQSGDRDIVNMSVELWDAAMAVNLRGPMLMCKHTVPHMIAAGYGAIVNTGSGVVFRGDTVRAAYAASKIGLHHLTMDVATAYGKQNVRCNVVSPGAIITPQLRAVLTAENIQSLTDQNSVNFIGEPKDIAEAACFLVSPAARYITGQVIPVDGGLHIHQAILGQAG